MPRGGYRPGAGRPRKAAQPEVAKEEQAEVRKAARKAGMTPLDYMLSVMNDADADATRRDRMAIAAAPFVHPKAADAQPGKKEQKQDAAGRVGGKFSTPLAPKLVVDNR